MVNVPSVPEIITVNSEALQTQIRDLLPSQNGFGSELQASNVITPIIDLTSAAEGSGVASNLQTALAFGSQTAFSVNNGNADQVSSPGFYRFTGTAVVASASTEEFARINLIDASATTKIAWQVNFPAGLANASFNSDFDYVIWLTTGDKVNLSASTRGVIAGSFRQIADSTGSLTNPSGFPL